MMTEELFNLAALALLGAGVCALIGTVQKKWRTELLMNGLNSLAVILLLIGFALRWKYYVDSMNVGWLLSFPVSTFYESASFFVLTLIVVLSWIQRKFKDHRIWVLADFFCGICLLGLALFCIPSQPILFLPSLKSYWLLAHVSLSFISYGIFALAALFAVLCIIRDKETTQLAECIRNLVRIGIVLFSIGGIFFGAMWAQSSWGRFWAWDPKETWAFITWCCYLALLHLDHRYKLSDRVLSMLTIGSFAVVLFTFVGVNILFAGLHSYATL